MRIVDDSWKAALGLVRVILFGVCAFFLVLIGFSAGLEKTRMWLWLLSLVDYQKKTGVPLH